MRIQHHVMVTTIVGFLLAGAAAAQLAPVQQTWSRTYGGAVDKQGLYDLRQLPDGQLVVAGFTASFGGPSPFNWLMRLELASGEVLFERASSSSLGGFTDGAAVSADGGALFLGRDVHDIQTKHDAWMVREDAEGQVQWAKGFATPGAGRFFLFDAAELDDGSWIAVGTAGVFDFPPQAAWVVRLSAEGEVLWQSEYGGGIADTARSVAATSDGGFAVAGWTNSSGAGSDDIWVMKLDSDGDVEWQKTFGGFDSDQAESIVELDDGGFAVAGSSNSLTFSGHAPLVLRLGADGALLWHKVVASEVWGDLGGVARTNDGQIVVVGRVSEPGFQTNDLWSAKLSAFDGRVAWQRAYEGDTGDFGSVVLPLTGAGFITGGTWGWGFPGESIWLQRTDRSGGLGCDLVRTTAFTLVKRPLTVKDGVAVRAPGTAQFQGVHVQFADSAADVIDVCR